MSSTRDPTPRPRPGTPAPSAAPAAARPADLALSAVGMVSAVGSDARQTFTSVRAGLRRMREVPELHLALPEDPRFDDSDPLVAAPITHLDARARKERRPAEWLALLAAEALGDLERAARLAPADAARLAVFLAIPERPGLGPEQVGELLRRFRAEAALDAETPVHVAQGGPGAALALAEQAAALLRDRKIGLAAIGAVDSWLFRPWLAALDRDWRLLTGRNPDGFQPGEAAAFFLLEPRGAPERRGARTRAFVRGFASARVDGRGAPNGGAELARVLEGLVRAPAPLLVCDLNGVAARTKEWALAQARLGPKLAGFALEHPASVLGDVGTATGASLVALGVHFLETRYGDGRPAVIWTAGDDGDRRALLLERA